MYYKNSLFTSLSTILYFSDNYNKHIDINLPFICSKFVYIYLLVYKKYLKNQRIKIKLNE